LQYCDLVNRTCFGELHGFVTHRNTDIIKCMSKIENNLKEQCKLEPESEFNLIITGFLESEKVKQLGLEPFSGLDNMYSGTLTGSKVLEVADIETVESVELDGVVGIFNEDQPII
jgi:hypothetical protein